MVRLRPFGLVSTFRLNGHAHTLHNLLGLLAGLGVCALSAQTVTLNGSFTGSTLDPGWAVGGTGYTPVFTCRA